MIRGHNKGEKTSLLTPSLSYTYEEFKCFNYYLPQFLTWVSQTQIIDIRIGTTIAMLPVPTCTVFMFLQRYETETTRSIVKQVLRREVNRLVVRIQSQIHPLRNTFSLLNLD